MGADTDHVEMCELAIRHAGVGTAQREEKAKAVAPVNQPTKSWRGKGIQKVANTPDAPGVMEAPRVRLEDPLHGGTVSIPPGSLFRCSRVLPLNHLAALLRASRKGRTKDNGHGMDAVATEFRRLMEASSELLFSMSTAKG